MGQCTGKALDGDADEGRPFHAALTDSRSTADTPASAKGATTPALSSFASLWPSPFPWSAAPSPVAVAITPSPAKCTPRRHLGRPPSPAKHIKSSLAKRFGRLPKPTEAPIPEDGGCRDGTEPEAERPSLEKRFGYDKNFRAKYEMGKEVGKGHFGHVYMARSKKGELKGQLVAVKVISKAKMKTAISIEDVRWEVKILKCLSGHKNMVQFYEAFEDDINVYIIMELCEGGELLDRILSRGGQHTEKDAKIIIIQILSVISFCHLQGVVHRDLKPENFLFTTGDKNAAIKIIDFGLSAFIRPDERLNDIVGSAYYVAPEVLHRSYNTEADMWSIGVIAYILLCGNRPFWARTESGIFRAVLRANPKFNDFSWPEISTEAKDFVRRLLSKDYRKRMSAAKALSHPWLREVHQQIPLDMFIYKSVKAYLRTTPFKRAALKVEFFPLEALSKSLPEDELIYIRTQFELLEPNNKDCISLDNFRLALWRNSTEAMTESRMPNILNALEPLSYRSMDFEEFCAATVSPYQLEALQDWEPIVTRAYQYFEQDGNRIISIHELAQEMNILAPAAYCMVRDWIRPGDGKLSFLGFTKLLHGVTIRSSKTARYHC